MSPPINSLISGYVVLIDDGLGGDYTMAYDGRLNPSLFTYTIENLLQQTTYRVMSYAINKAGNGVNSTETTCFTATIPG